MTSEEFNCRLLGSESTSGIPATTFSYLPTLFIYITA